MLSFYRTPEEEIARLSPWKRKRPEMRSMASLGIYQHTFEESFDSHISANIDLDIETKRAALQAFPFVVSLVSLTGGAILFKGSGTIIDNVDLNGRYSTTILTSASLLRSSAEVDDVADEIEVNVYLKDGKLFKGQVFSCDFHYNLATIKIESDAQMAIASFRHLDDSLSVDPSEILFPKNNGVVTRSFELPTPSNLFKLCPGDIVVALGRFSEKPYELMAAPGKFSADCCGFDCKELFTANCKISKCGIGGPLINQYGEVIGVNFYDSLSTPFLPINIVSKCLEHFKKYGRFCRPWLGMEVTNLYVARVGKLDAIIRKFPDIVKGALVEEVTPGSPADCAGILSDDVIVKCGEKVVRSCLEFFEILFDNVGKSVRLVVIRESSGVRLKPTVVVGESSPDKFNSWPLPEVGLQVVESLRL